MDKINVTYGYICIQKKIYNLGAFYKNNVENVDTVLNLTENDNFGITFEQNVDEDVVCAFSIFGNSPQEAKKNYDFFFKVLKSVFPSAKEIIRMDFVGIDDTEYFNGSTLNPFPHKIWW